MIKSEWITGIAIFLMLGSLIVGTSIYYNEEVNECTSNPLSYGAKQMEDRFGYKFIGTGYFVVPIDKKAPTIIFNKHNLSIN